MATDHIPKRTPANIATSLRVGNLREASIFYPRCIWRRIRGTELRCSAREQPQTALPCVSGRNQAKFNSASSSYPVWEEGKKKSQPDYYVTVKLQLQDTFRRRRLVSPRMTAVEKEKLISLLFPHTQTHTSIHTRTYTVCGAGFVTVPPLREAGGTEVCSTALHSLSHDGQVHLNDTFHIRFSFSKQ